MKIDFKVEDPEDIEFTATITMKLRTWKALKEKITDMQFSMLYSNINNVVDQAIESFCNQSRDK